MSGLQGQHSGDWTGGGLPNDRSLGCQIAIDASDHQRDPYAWSGQGLHFERREENWGSGVGPMAPAGDLRPGKGDQFEVESDEEEEPGGRNLSGKHDQVGGAGCPVRPAGQVSDPGLCQGTFLCEL